MGLQLSSKIQKELVFCHMISLRCCDSMKAVAIVSNDYDHIIEQLIEYFRDDRIKCSFCPRKICQSLLN